MHLTSHLGARPVWNDRIAAFVPGTLPAGMARGRRRQRRARTGGRLGRRRQDRPAGGRRLRLRAANRSTCPMSTRRARPLTPLWRVRGVRGKAFVDLQNDVTDDDVALAGHEGFRAVEHLKRYTTLGMATDQGKTSNVNGLALMAEFTARTIPQTGTTTFRPPFTPVAIGALAGTHRGKDFKPTRLPPSHQLGAGAGRRVRRDGLLAARAMVSAARRDRLAREREPRGAHRSLERGRVRCVDARQDRPAGGGRGRVPGAPLYQQLEDPRRRQGALRPHAARGRVGAGRRHHLAPRRGSLHRHHHHRQRGQGPAAHGVLPPVAVAGTRRAVLLRERAMGAVLRRRPALARCPAQDRRSPARHLQRGLSRIWRRPS